MVLLFGARNAISRLGGCSDQKQEAGIEAAKIGGGDGCRSLNGIWAEIL